MPPPAAVEVVDLVKRYGRTTAVDGVSFHALSGAITALLGPNGAGKTTTVETCEGYRRPDSGTVRVLGRAAGDPTLRTRVGVMLQGGGGYPGAHADELLRLVATYHAAPVDPGYLLDRLGLTAAGRTPYRRLSGGQRQQLGLAMAIVGRPELVFLDEPTGGLDPQARHLTWELLEELRGSGVAVVLTTHQMDEAERLADRVVIIDAGRVVADASPADLVRGSGTGALLFQARAGLDLEPLLAALPGMRATEGPAGRYTLEGPVDPRTVAAVTAWCAARDVLIDDLRIGGRSLEDVFLELTGRSLRP